MRRVTGALAALALSATATAAEVQERAPHGFKVGGQVTIDARLTRSGPS